MNDSFKARMRSPWHSTDVGKAPLCSGRHVVEALTPRIVAITVSDAYSLS